MKTVGPKSHMTQLYPKLGNPLDEKTEKQKIITQNYTKNKKAKNNYLSVARFFGTIFQERKNEHLDPACKKSTKTL